MFSMNCEVLVIVNTAKSTSCHIVTDCVIHRPLPTFLKNKKKRKPVVSDGSDGERTPPPASPTDDSLVSCILR